MAAPLPPVVRGTPLAGPWLFTSRPGAEGDLVEEVELILGRGTAEVVGPSLVRAQRAPASLDGALDLTFARQGFRIIAEISGAATDFARLLTERIAAAISAAPWTENGAARLWGLSIWVPDAESVKPLDPVARDLEKAVLEHLADFYPNLFAQYRSVAELPASGAEFFQVAITEPARGVLGRVSTECALSLAPGGRIRMRVSADRPSRAARKVEEAMAWMGLGPGAGEVCVDLGAAPGGWSWVLLKRKARVIAVDPAQLRPDVAGHRGLIHRCASAFQFEPDEPVDWLFCDMAWRPLEVAALLEKWGRRGWASFLVANFKLPMKRKAEMVERIREKMGASWKRISTRQLYHDREEITLVAHR